MNIQFFGWYPFNPLLGSTMQDGVGNSVDRGFIAHLAWSAAQAVAADPDGIFDNIPCSGDSAVTALPTAATFKNQPPCARNVVVTPAGTTASVKAVAVKITGTDISGAVITEDLTLTVDSLNPTTGAKAFASITKVEIPAMDGAGVTLDVGFGDILGIPYLLTHNTVLAAYLNNVKEGTAPTVTVSATAMSENTIDLSSPLNGKVVDAYAIV